MLLSKTRSSRCCYWATLEEPLRSLRSSGFQFDGSNPLAGAFPGPSPPPQSNNNSAASAPHVAAALAGAGASSCPRRSDTASSPSTAERDRGALPGLRGEGTPWLMAVPYPALPRRSRVGGWMDGRMERMLLLTCSPSVCQIDPVPKPSAGWLLLPRRRSPGTWLLAPEPPPDPAPSLETAAVFHWCIFVKRGSLLTSEVLFPTDDALSTSVFANKPNKPLKQQRQQQELCWECSQTSVLAPVAQNLPPGQWMGTATRSGQCPRAPELLLGCVDQELLATQEQPGRGSWLWLVAAPCSDLGAVAGCWG